MTLRGQPELIPALAQRLYDGGKTRSEVLQAVYGVDLPREAILFWEAYEAGTFEPRIRMFWSPWSVLAQPIEPPLEYSRRVERIVFEQAPDMLPLMATGYADAPGGKLSRNLIGYQIDDLRAGRETIVGTRWPVDIHDTVRSVRVLGPGLLDVLRLCVTEYCDMIEAAVGDPWEEFDQEDLDDAEAHLRHVQDFQRQVMGELRSGR